MAQAGRQPRAGLDRFSGFPAAPGHRLFLFIALPAVGYDEDPTNAGYLYLDAYRRDGDAWRLAESGEPLGMAFQEEFTTDQYGGLLSLSAAVYRVFSPDGHRPLLILILTSFAAAAGLPFLWQVVRKRWGGTHGQRGSLAVRALSRKHHPGRFANARTHVDRPDSRVRLGRGQMERQQTRSLLALGISFLLMLFLSFKAAGAVLAAMAVWFWLGEHPTQSRQNPARRRLPAAGCRPAVRLYFSGSWLVDSSKWTCT